MSENRPVRLRITEIFESGSPHTSRQEAMAEVVPSNKPDPETDPETVTALTIDFKVPSRIENGDHTCCDLNSGDEILARGREVNGKFYVTSFEQVTRAGNQAGEDYAGIIMEEEDCDVLLGSFEIVELDYAREMCEVYAEDGSYKIIEFAAYQLEEYAADFLAELQPHAIINVIYRHKSFDEGGNELIEPVVLEVNYDDAYCYRDGPAL